jgi:GAF domain-containing protein
MHGNFRHPGGRTHVGRFRGQLQLVASTGEKADLLEIMQLNSGQGPGVECFETGHPVASADIANSGDRWPDFRSEALKPGFRSIYATPLRLRGQTIGTLNLLSSTVGELNERRARDCG